MGKIASYYTQHDGKEVRCMLCPHECLIQSGSYGICLVRKNIAGDLFTLNYELISAFHSDPIEKKPLYHFYPGKRILSIGSIGCNLKCDFCQNSSISAARIETFIGARFYTSDFIVDEAKKIKDNLGIAFTYNEPVVSYEFVLETAIKIKQSGLMNVMVSNGYINEEPLKELVQWIDAFNIDLKAYTDQFYKTYTKSTLSPVLNTIETIIKSKKHLELTFLVIPSLNDQIDSFEDMLKTLRAMGGKHTVLHISKYHPAHKMSIPPTPTKTMYELYELANNYLDYVYLGNIITDKGQNTYCPNCKSLIISRSVYHTENNGLTEGRCKYCSNELPIIT